MEIFSLVIVVFLAILTWFHFFKRRPEAAKLPPGPKPFPIIGNILQVDAQKPHQSLANLSKTYGPIMSLQLGSIYTVVISSPEVAKEIMQKQDLVFSSRTIPAAAHVYDHHKISVGFLPVGDEWRQIRKLSKDQMFSTQRLEASQSLRQEKLQKLLEYVQQCSDGGRAVDIGEAAFVTTVNLMSATLFSTEFITFDSDATGIFKFREIFAGLVNIVGVPNIADFFPILQPIDPQGIQRKAEYYFGKVLDFIGDLIEQRLKSRGKTPPPPRKNDLLETILDLSHGSEYNFTINDFKHILLDLFVAASHTTASATEWVMTELLLNPSKLSKAQQEIMAVVGEKNQVQESDISNLPYFQAIMKEVLRYHPPGPLLVPRKSEQDAEVCGYFIPKGSQIIVNVWAMGRDPNLWPNPHSFQPERFLDKKIDFKGQDFELIPFGSGRRMCPGFPLANRMLPMTVATLIRNFNWKLEPGADPEQLREELYGIALRRALPLKAIPVKL